jgi:hypothetical protein
MQLYIFWAALWLGLMTVATEATWKPQYADADPKIVQWYGSQHNKRGDYCCNDADGHPFYGNYTLNRMRTLGPISIPTIDATILTLWLAKGVLPSI